MIEATETMIFKESFEFCPFIRETQKESRRNAEVRNNEKRMDQELETDIPEEARLKAHLKRRVERRTKNRWVQYATEYASEVAFSGPARKETMRRYMDMTRDAVMEMNRRDKAKKKKSREKKRIGNTPFYEETY